MHQSIRLSQAQRRETLTYVVTHHHADPTSSRSLILGLQPAHQSQQTQAKTAQQATQKRSLTIVAGGHRVENRQRQGFGAAQNIAPQHQANAHLAHAPRQRQQDARQQG